MFLWYHQNHSFMLFLTEPVGFCWVSDICSARLNELLSLRLPAATKRPSSASSLSGIVGRMMSSGERGASSSSCTSVNTVCSEGERPTSFSLSSSTSSVSLQDASHSSSSSSSSLPYGAVPAYVTSSSSSTASTPKRNSSDISLDLTPITTLHGGVTKATGVTHAPKRHTANQVPAAVEATPRQLSRLQRVVLEIVQTEQAYVRDLRSIVEVRPLKRSDETQLLMLTLAVFSYIRT